MNRIGEALLKTQETYERTVTEPGSRLDPAQVRVRRSIAAVAAVLIVPAELSVDVEVVRVRRSGRG